MTAVPFIVRIVLCWLVIGSGVATATAQGAPEDQPDAFVRYAVADVLSVVFADDASRQAVRLDDRVLPVLRQYLDFTAVTRRAIGPAWRQLADEERQRAVEAFSTIVVRSYATRLDSRQRPEITYDTAVPLSPERWEVASRIAVAGTAYRVAYRLERAPDAWRIYDIVVEGVSMAANYRAQLDAIFQKGGASAVLQALERQARPITGT